MSETIAAVLPYISAASSIVSAGASLAGGAASSGAGAAQAAQYEDEKNAARTQAAIDEADRRRELASVLATQKAVRSGRGLELFSPTFQNIQDVTVRQAEDDINLIQLNSLNRQRRLGLGANAANAQSNSALLGGVGGAVGALGTGAGRWPQDKKDPKGGES